MMKKPGWGRLLLAGMALLLIAAAWWQVVRVPRGLVVRPLTRDGVVMRFIAPEGAVDVPGVLVAHGFAGSQQLMLGYGYTLAKAGYGVLLWDFRGFGASPPAADAGEGSLQADVDAAYAALLAQPEVDAARVAILGHSMGSGAAMRAGIAQPERYGAVVAISPSNAAVTPALPRNLLLQAGALERPFAERAAELLLQAGGASDDFAAGRARDFVLVPNVEHISILFTHLSHAAARDWLNGAFGVETAVAYADWRIVWYALHLLGWLLLAAAAAPLLRRETAVRPAPLRRPWLGLLLAAPLATGLLALIGRFAPVSELGGVLVGGGIGLWFLLFGLGWLLIGGGWPRPTRRGAARRSAARRSAVLALLQFALLWLAFGALGQLVWLPWLLIPMRLVRWPLLALAFVPWLLAAGAVQQGAAPGRRVLWWLAQSAAAAAGLGAAVFLVPGLFFVLLILPVVPLVLAVMGFVGWAVDDAWGTAVGNALFFAWLLLAVFPLAA